MARWGSAQYWHDYAEHAYDNGPAPSRVNSPGIVRDWWWVENGRVHFEPPPILNVRAWGVPNRLYGATINREGDAI